MRRMIVTPCRSVSRRRWPRTSGSASSACSKDRGGSCSAGAGARRGRRRRARAAPLPARGRHRAFGLALAPVDRASALPVRRLPVGAHRPDARPPGLPRGHIPGASFLDVDEDLADRSRAGEGRHPLPAAERFADVASRAGIGEGVFVVAYGSMGAPSGRGGCCGTSGTTSAVLVGGIEAWRRVAHWRGGDRAGCVPCTRTRWRHDRGGRDRAPGRPRRRRRATRSRWRGEPNPIDVVPGRIPGAVNAPWNEPLADVPPGEVAAYCGSGITSCVTIHRLWLAGRTRLYPGSWSQWETLDLPVIAVRSGGRGAGEVPPALGIFGAASWMNSAGFGGVGGSAAPCAPRAAAGSPSGGCTARTT